MVDEKYELEHLAKLTKEDVELWKEAIRYDKIINNGEVFVKKSTDQELNDYFDAFKAAKQQPKVKLPARLKVKKLDPEAELPTYAKPGDSGMDVRSTIKCQLSPGQHMTVPTGLAFEIPLGYEIQVRSRSGLAAKHGVAVLNSPGTVDSSYTGEVKVILINHSANTFVINKGDRIAQLVVAEVCEATLEEVTDLAETERGADGLGSTGVK